MSDDMAGLLEQVMDVARQRIGTRTVTLFLGSQQRPIQYGTGVLLQVADEHFVLTAAHVTDPAATGGPFTMCLGGFAEPHDVIPLPGAGFLFTPMPKSGKRDDDYRDTSIIYLTSDTADRVRTSGLEFTTTRDLDAFTVGGFEHPYVVCGYPRALSIDHGDAGIESGEFLAVTGRKDPVAGELHRFNDRTEFVLSFDHRHALDRHLKRVSVPHPRGISGCGVWRLTVAGPDFPNNLRIDLVGIQHTYNAERKLLRCTRLREPILDLYGHRVGLRPAMEVSMPALRQLYEGR